MRYIILTISILITINGFSQDSNDWHSELNKIFLKYASKGNNKKVIELLDKGANVNAVSKFGNIAYMYAVKNGEYKTARILMLNGANLSLDSFKVSTKDYYIFPYNDTSSYKGADINYDLLLQTYYNNTDSVRLLLKQGADANSSSVYEDIHALVYAVSNSNARLVELLINWGADVNYVSTNGDNAFLDAVNNNNISIVKLFLRKKVNINIMDYNKATALHYAVGNNNYNLSNLLLKNGVSVNLKSEGKNTALDLAVITNNLRITELLLNNKANINTKDNYNNTPLIVASQYNYFNMVDFLLQNNADYKFINNYGENAFTTAIHNGNKEIAELIFNQDSVFFIKNTDKKHITELADLSENKEIKIFLKQKGFKRDIMPKYSRWYLGTGFITSKKDFMISNTFGIKDTKYNMFTSLNFATRYWKNRVLYPTKTENTYMQLWERRTMLSIDLDKRFNLMIKENNKFGAFVGTKVLYTFGKYKGVDFKIDDKIIPAPKLGVYYNNNYLSISLNYEYYNWGILGVSNHKISSSIIVYLNSKYKKSHYKKTIEWF